MRAWTDENKHPTGDPPRLFVHRFRTDIRPMDWTHMSEEDCRQLDEDDCWKRVDRAEFNARDAMYQERRGPDLDGAA